MKTILVRNLASLGTALAIAGAPASGFAALDLNAPLVCAIVDIYDCSGMECVEVESETVGVPDLIRLDAKSKTLAALDLEFGGTTTPLDSVREEQGKVIARALSGDRSLILAVDETLGDALLTVSDVHLTLVGYGTCAKY